MWHKADIQCALFDYIVGAGKHGLRNGEIERPGGLSIDHQFVLGRHLHRQVGRLLAFEDAIDVDGRAPALVDKSRSIQNQSASIDICAIGVDRGQFVLGGERDDEITMDRRQRTRR